MLEHPGPKAEPWEWRLYWASHHVEEVTSGNVGHHRGLLRSDLDNLQATIREALRRAKEKTS